METDEAPSEIASTQVSRKITPQKISHSGNRFLCLLYNVSPSLLHDEKEERQSDDGNK